MPTVRQIAVIAASLLMAIGHAISPAAAQSILRDAETEAFFRDIGRPLAAAAGLRPEDVQIRVVGDPSINAFATTGQRIFFHSGLLIRATDVLQVEGVLAHELGHVAGGHMIRFDEGAGPATSISLIGLVAGIALAAAGAGDAGMAAMLAGQQAAMGKFLAFSREQEIRADQAGARYLNKAGIDGSGMISFFRELQGDEYRLAIPQDDAYSRTHPLSGQRITGLEDVLSRSPAWQKGPDPGIEARYQRIRAKLIGYISKPSDVFRTYPAGDRSVPAHVARAYAYHRQSKTADAIAELEAALRILPDDPYLLEMEGQVLLESGQPGEALSSLRRATELTRSEPLIASMLGHALVLEGERKGNAGLMAEAETVLRASIARDPDNPFAWLQLATIYDRRGDAPRLALATAERLSLIGGDPRGILRSAGVAAAGLPKNTPEWLWAEDLVVFARQRLAEMKKHRKD